MVRRGAVDGDDDADTQPATETEKQSKKKRCRGKWKREQRTKAHQKEGSKMGFFVFNALNWFIYNHKYIYIFLYIN